MATDTARTISLTIAQRFGLEELLGAQKGKRKDTTILYEIRRKVKPTVKDKKDWSERKIIVPIQNGFGIDEELAEAQPPFEVYLEKEEVRRLRTLGDEIDLTPAIMDWHEPLMEQLEAKVEPKTGPALVEASA